MKPSRPLALVPLLFAFACASPADMVLTGGRIHTLDPARPQAEALAVRDGAIVAVGSADEVAGWIGAGTEVIELRGRAAYPGFADSHVHLAGLGRSLGLLDLRGTRSEAEVVARVAESARQAPPGTWIVGRGWDQNDWPTRAFPDHRALTAAVPRHPVVLWRIDGHALLANAEAMRRAGVTEKTTTPAGGAITAGPDGAPAGVFIDNAMDLVEAVVPPDDPAARRAEIGAAIARLHSRGVTSIHDAGVDEDLLDLYVDMARAGEFDLRDHVMVDPDGFRRDTQGNEADQRARWLTPMTNLGGTQRINKRAIKVSADGALGSRGAALLEPYDDDPGSTGLDLMPPAAIEDLAVEALRRGMQLCVHAIGDRANRQVLDAIARALQAVPPRHRGMLTYGKPKDPGRASTGRQWSLADQAYGMGDVGFSQDESYGPLPPEHRFRIEHAQVLAPADIPRFARLGVIPSMQAQHQTSDMAWAEDRLGPGRLAGAYAWRSLLDTGVIIAGGSDAPVEDPAPIVDFHAATTRRDPDGRPPGGWRPEQAMTRAEALSHLTLWPAMAAHDELRLGSLAPGRLADIVVLSDDLLEVPEERLLDVVVDLTIFDGRVVYARDVAP